jgi:hypothetical protein
MKEDSTEQDNERQLKEETRQRAQYYILFTRITQKNVKKPIMVDKTNQFVRGR